MGGSGRDRDGSRARLDDMFPGRVSTARADDMTEVRADESRLDGLGTFDSFLNPRPVSKDGGERQRGLQIHKER